MRRVRQSSAGRRIASGDYPQYPPADLDACARLDAFDFAIRVVREGELLVARRVEFA